jgi:DHA1 family tetracycline resistance protein-like MFS transporter
MAPGRAEDIARRRGTGMTDQNQPQATGVRRAAFSFIFASALINSLSFGIMIPVLPKLVEQLAGGDTAFAAEWNVVLATSWGLMQFVFGPILGMLSDRFGRRPVLLISIFGLGIDFIVMAFAPDMWWLLIGRIVSGITASSFSTANAYVADVTAPEDRAKSFGLMGSAFSFGFLIGPVLGGFLGKDDLHLPFFAAAGLCLINFVYGYFVLPESLPVERRRAVTWGSANPITSLKKLGQLEGIGSLVLVIALSNLAQFVMYTVWVLYTTFKFGWGPTENGWSMPSASRRP